MSLKGIPPSRTILTPPPVQSITVDATPLCNDSAESRKAHPTLASNSVSSNSNRETEGLPLILADVVASGLPTRRIKASVVSFAGIRSPMVPDSDR